MSALASLHEALFEHVSHAFISIGLDRRISFFNRAEEVVGHHTPLRFHELQEIAVAGVARVRRVGG